MRKIATSELMHLIQLFSDIKIYISIIKDQIIILNDNNEILNEYSINCCMSQQFRKQKYNYNQQCILDSYLYNLVLCQGVQYIQIFERVFYIENRTLAPAFYIPELNLHCPWSFYGCLFSYNDQLYVSNQKQVYVYHNNKLKFIKDLYGTFHQFADFVFHFKDIEGVLSILSNGFQLNVVSNQLSGFHFQFIGNGTVIFQNYQKALTAIYNILDQKLNIVKQITLIERLELNNGLKMRVPECFQEKNSSDNFDDLNLFEESVDLERIFQDRVDNVKKVFIQRQMTLFPNYIQQMELFYPYNNKIYKYQRYIPKIQFFQLINVQKIMNDLFMLIEDGYVYIFNSLLEIQHQHSIDYDYYKTKSDARSVVFNNSIFFISQTHLYQMAGLSLNIIPVDFTPNNILVSSGQLYISSSDALYLVNFDIKINFEFIKSLGGPLFQYKSNIYAISRRNTLFSVNSEFTQIKIKQFQVLNSFKQIQNVLIFDCEDEFLALMMENGELVQIKDPNVQVQFNERGMHVLNEVEMDSMGLQIQIEFVKQIISNKIILKTQNLERSKDEIVKLMKQCSENTQTAIVIHQQLLNKFMALQSTYTQ
ncbi:Conserved_hypothetical protein [Hexamita inflata]|uniref:Uncharacterized protein n=1 Tax=Hexamita inflata TaxID=28002 RepID=A0AA86TPI1_9EUKA|nr:Conserved hypothetical protein [Hexamita inflata]